MADRRYGPHGHFFPGDVSGKQQATSNSQETGQFFVNPGPWLTPDSSHPSGGTPMTQHNPYSSTTKPANQKQPYDLGRDELMARFLGWEMTQGVRVVLSNQEERKKYVSNNWFNMCETLEKDYAAKNEAIRRNSYDEVWCPMKLENYYNFIKQETKTHYPEDYARIAWNKKMDKHIRIIMLNQMAHKADSLLGCIAILKSSLRLPESRDKPPIPQITTPSYASSGLPSIWGPPNSTPYTQIEAQRNTNPGKSRDKGRK